MEVQNHSQSAKSSGVSDSAVIETRGLTKTYGRVTALDSLDLRVRENSIFGFLGPNGAGKSTTMKLLLGLVRPTSGTGTVFGRDIVAEDFEIRRRVGYLAQDPRYYGHMTARETLRFAARFFYEGPEAAIERRVRDSLALVGLSDRADRRIRGFSGGERQRLGLAQAQINDPDLLILDEPAASLDPMGRRDVLEIMERLRDERGATIFYSTHILDDVQRVSDSVAILRGGRLLANAPINELLAARDGEAALYEITVKGDSREALQSAKEAVRSLAWVSSLEESRGPAGERHWLVGTSDESAAERELLPLLVGRPDVRVTSFGRKKHDLQEAFFGLIEGEG
ncbi:ABC-type multidrug transport system ATPase component [Rubrobacter radiotolerans]|uniref:ABC transporter ATP-binding protein n=1 Tax=Rubrobacter radiotolerans TaxID=42256 RepID=A0A023X0Q8_RUBRA|nr:ABC transporter ATP-binding protein [Rubrobacter radiotolerans]AHY45565.1 ABC-type multidrug transport system ATPase component [Rubrobacter radiotolerans]MDX5892979.1 ABC transporter ATP-binding protein [Rubrobacter radiotolerans]SMC02848.1 ABC-2 type transport system ATP-binding protein [Rubrobacter radiotolerans DSM 5868]